MRSILAAKLVIGRNSVREVLEHAPDRIQELVFAYGKKDSERDKRAQELLQLAKSKGVKIKTVSLAELNKLSASEAHQSFAAVLEDAPMLELKDLLLELEGKERALLLLLDSISDPHNFGAILRAAECFAVDAVILSIYSILDKNEILSKSLSIPALKA